MQDSKSSPKKPKRENYEKKKDDFITKLSKQVIIPIILLILAVTLNQYLLRPSRDTKPSLEAMFSPRGGIMERIVREIDSSTKTIDIAMYSFTKTEIAEALSRAKNRGVAIRIILDNDQSSNRNSKIQFFRNCGFEYKCVNSRVMHNKYAVIDNRMLITGSYNWTGAAEKSNFENILFISNVPEAIKSYNDNFEKLWRNAR